MSHFLLVFNRATGLSFNKSFDQEKIFQVSIQHLFLSSDSWTCQCNFNETGKANNPLFSVPLWKASVSIYVHVCMFDGSTYKKSQTDKKWVWNRK